MEGLLSAMVVIGPILLIAVIGFAMYRNRKHREPGEIARTERATRDVYEETKREDIEADRKDPLS